MTERLFHNEADQAERRDLLDNHLRLREQGSTYHAHTYPELDEGGRYARQMPMHMVGSEPIPNYPAAADWTRAHTGEEPPFPVDISAVEPVGEAFEVEKSLRENSADALPQTAERAARAPASTSVERAPSAFKRRV